MVTWVPTFALAIPHTPWVPERLESLRRLKTELRIFDLPPGSRPDGDWYIWDEREQHAGRSRGCGVVDYRLFSDREPNWSWSARLWQWGLDSGATHIVQLQDDVQVGPDFWPQLRAMVEAVPDAILGLESVMAIGSPWYTTGDGLIGVGYVIPRDDLRELLNFRDTPSFGEHVDADRLPCLRPGSAERLNEDQLIGMFTFSTGRKIWHPVPTIIDHNVDIASTYGNDSHSHRRPARSTVRGDRAPESWGVPEQVPHVAKFYGATPRMCRMHVRGYSYKKYREDSRL